MHTETMSTLRFILRRMKLKHGIRALSSRIDNIDTAFQMNTIPRAEKDAKSFEMKQLQKEDAHWTKIEHGNPEDFLEIMERMTDDLESALDPAGCTEEELRTWHRVMQDCALDEILIDRRGFEISRETLQKLGGEHESSRTVDLYMVLLQEREGRSQGTLPSSHFFDSSFLMCYYKDGDYRFQDVCRWKKNRNICQVDLWFFPVCINFHWTLVVVDIKGKRIRHINSLPGAGGSDKTLLKHFRQYVNDEFGREGLKLVLCEDSSESGPHQEDSVDCALFVMMAADRLSNGLRLDYDQNQMRCLRRKVLHCLVQGRVD